MPAPTGFIQHLLDLLQPLGVVRARAMFGGWGFYSGEQMFALVAFDTFYVKVDDVSRGEFERAGMTPFVYEAKGGKSSVMSYYTVPADALESSTLLCEWAGKGRDAAARAAVAKRRAKTRR